MPTFNQILRVRGPKIGFDDTYVDVEVTEYSIDGHVRLVEDVADSPRETTVLASELQDWISDVVATLKDELSDPENRVWRLISELEDATDNSDIAPIESELKELVDELYQKTSNAQTSVGPPENAGPPDDVGPNR